MKKLITLLMVALMFSSCSLFEAQKKPTIEKASITAQKAAVKYLGCETGQAVYDDVEAEMTRILKPKESLTKSFLPPVVKDICVASVTPVVEKVVALGNDNLPEDWKADGCNISGFEAKAKELIITLCKL